VEENWNFEIIPKLSVSLEEWEKLKEIRNWGALIRETFGNFIYMVGDFKESVMSILNSIENMWKGTICEWKIKRDVWDYYYLSYTQRSSLILPRAAFKDKLKENELLRPNSPK